MCNNNKNDTDEEKTFKVSHFSMSFTWLATDHIKRLMVLAQHFDANRKMHLKNWKAIKCTAVKEEKTTKEVLDPIVLLALCKKLQKIYQRKSCSSFIFAPEFFSHAFFIVVFHQMDDVILVWAEVGRFYSDWNRLKLKYSINSWTKAFILCSFAVAIG